MLCHRPTQPMVATKGCAGFASDLGLHTSGLGKGLFGPAEMSQPPILSLLILPGGNQQTSHENVHNVSRILTDSGKVEAANNLKNIFKHLHYTTPLSVAPTSLQHVSKNNHRNFNGAQERCERHKGIATMPGATLALLRTEQERHERYERHKVSLELWLTWPTTKAFSDRFSRAYVVEIQGT